MAVLSLGEPMLWAAKQLRADPGAARKRTVTPKDLTIPHNSLLVMTAAFRRGYETSFENPMKKNPDAKLDWPYHINLTVRDVIPPRATAAATGSASTE